MEEAKAVLLPGGSVLLERADGYTAIIYRHQNGYLYHQPVVCGEYVG